MNLVLFTHPGFLGLTSQTHFAQMLASGFARRGHQVELRQPRAFARRLFATSPIAKWAGYVDQYLLFPWAIWWAQSRDPAGTLYVFCDQALGPWIPHLTHRPHVVHNHDLLALRSALGDVPQNPVSVTGRIYQRYIRWGFSQARHFISVSHQSRADLHRFGRVQPVRSEVVYNGLNRPFERVERDVALQAIRAAGLPSAEAGFLLHVGGGLWYKNSEGVVQLYAQHAEDMLASAVPVRPLWMVSPPPSQRLRSLIEQLPAAAEVRFFQGLDGECLQALYSCAEMLLLPSLAEGFGWPIVEALACGCPVLTTAQPPMTEVGGSAAHYLPLLEPDADVQAWATSGASLMRALLERSQAERAAAAASAMAWAARFSADQAIDGYLAVYAQVLQSECPQLQVANAR